MGEDRGQPFYVVARASSTLEMCHRTAYDVERWVEENLVDILISAGNAATDPAPQVGDFVDLCRGTGIGVYPGFDGALPARGTRGRRHQEPVAHSGHRQPPPL